MKWEIEGELYLRENDYDMYSVVEPCVITNNIDRDTIIYKDRDYCSYKHPSSDHIIRDFYLSEWLENTVGMVAAREEFEFVEGKRTHLESFQPQTKKVRITIEEIE